MQWAKNCRAFSHTCIYNSKSFAGQFSFFQVVGFLIEQFLFWIVRTKIFQKSGEFPANCTGFKTYEGRNPRDLKIPHIERQFFPSTFSVPSMPKQLDNPKPAQEKPTSTASKRFELCGYNCSAFRVSALLFALYALSLCSHLCRYC